jgi:hypothetical protein
MPGRRPAFFVVSLLAVLWFASPALSADNTRPALTLNQDYINDIGATSTVDTDDAMSVFAFVFSQLPDSVTIYPTENYFYFSFFHNGIELAGNIRLDALDRDDGIAHFAYYSAYTMWNEDLVSAYRQLNTDEGVEVEQQSRFVYDVTYAGRTVQFLLNDLSHVRPPDTIVAAGEQYIGPVYDESGLSFYLLYNRDLKMFHYIVNDDVSAPETYLPSQVSPRLLIGQRTGFAIYEDDLLPRRILVGVYEGNSMVNNYFDGPFDQLPDNFIEGDAFRDVLEHAFPAVTGLIDRFGNSDGGASRLLITPYIYYASQRDLVAVADCAAEASADALAYYRCFGQGQPDYNELEGGDAAEAP